MAEDLVILEGSSFFVSEPGGDVRPDGGARGFFHADTRHLSLWQVLVGGRPLHLLTSQPVEARWGRMFGIVERERPGEAPGLLVRRDRIVGAGVHEDLGVENLSDEAVELEVELRFGTDFADIFEVKGWPPGPVRRVEAEVGGDHVTLAYQSGGFRRSTGLWFQRPDVVEEDRVLFRISLGPRRRWETCLEVSCHSGEPEERPEAPCPARQTRSATLRLTETEWLGEAPDLDAAHDDLRHAYRRSLLDLAALRFRPLEELEWSLPAAGLPWFMALFGRDSLLTAYQALPFQPTLARGTLEALAALQAADFDDFRDSEPGKILHELRRGELTMPGQPPHSPYYGAHDSTPLFLVLLDEYVRWSGDLEFARRLGPAARAALEWVERHGDPDGDGYLEYRSRSRAGLRNQGWKDSGNAVCFADGRLAEPPIALCEIQGYAYDARVRCARLAREAWADHELAARLEEEARRLRERFHEDFWIEERGHHALALDGGKKRVDSLTSNVGHLLWSGILDPEVAGQTVKRLMSPDMFTGWGIRTMWEGDAAYNPMEYHNGSVWPHDTSLIAEGMRRYGYREEASSLVVGLLEAARSFEYRLPELFAGLARQETLIPVEYPGASRPQAWATGAPLLGLRTLLGLDVVEGRLVSDPWLPPGFGEVVLGGVPVPAGRADARG